LEIVGLIVKLGRLSLGRTSSNLLVGRLFWITRFRNFVASAALLYWKPFSRDFESAS
jgi:hypothetical protein